ncbi:MAG: PIN domain-containing protein [Chitinophagales bacterium]
MKIVIDTNIVISTLIKSDGSIGKLLLRELNDFDKIACHYLYIELFDKKEKMLKLSKLTDEEFLDLLYLLIKKVDFINEEQITDENWKKAFDLTKDVDVKDISHVALTIHTNAKLWTGDKKLYNGLKAKGFEDVINTNEIRNFLAEYKLKQ